MACLKFEDVPAGTTEGLTCLIRAQHVVVFVSSQAKDVELKMALPDFGATYNCIYIAIARKPKPHTKTSLRFVADSVRSVNIAAGNCFLVFSNHVECQWTSGLMLLFSRIWDS